MKKILFIPLIINAETCDNDKITLELLANETHYEGNVTVKSDPVINGKNINVDLVMFDQGDAVGYVFDIINNSNEDYEIDKNSFNINSDYINYSLNLEDNSTIVKAGTRQRASLIVEYANPVPTDTLLAGPVTDNKTITVNLSAGQDIENPKTGVHDLLMIIILLSLSLITFLVLRKKKYIKILVIIIVSAFIIPISVYAICKCEIKIESNIKIEYLNSYFRLCMGSSFGQSDVYIPYRKGMTWIEFDDYILENYQKYKTYIQKSDGTLEEYGYLKKYGMDKDRIVLRNPGEFEFSEHVLPVTDTDNPDILYDNFFSFGKHKQPYSFTPVDYSYPNEYWAIENFETLYPEEYSQMATTDRWWIYNENIFEAKYGCYYFNGG